MAPHISLHVKVVHIENLNEISFSKIEKLNVSIFKKSHHFIQPWSLSIKHYTATMSYTKEQEAVVLRVLSYKGHQYYEILEVTKTSTESEIKKSYRRLAIKCHPDKNPHPRSSEAFKVVNKSWEVLSDPQKRRIYDQTGQTPHLEYQTPVLLAKDLVRLQAREVSLVGHIVPSMTTYSTCSLATVEVLSHLVLHSLLGKRVYIPIIWRRPGPIHEAQKNYQENT